jgi:hypothetical protein
LINSIKGVFIFKESFLNVAYFFCSIFIIP